MTYSHDALKGGGLIIEDNTENRHVQNRTEGFLFRTWFCRVLGCKLHSLRI